MWDRIEANSVVTLNFIHFRDLKYQLITSYSPLHSGIKISPFTAKQCDAFPLEFYESYPPNP